MRPFTLEQPGSSPLDIPEYQPNPAYAPKREEPLISPPPSREREREPAPKVPDKVPERV